MSYRAWLEKVDRVVALLTEGSMHDDFAYDWRGAWEWGETPIRAVRAAQGCTRVA